MMIIYFQSEARGKMCSKALIDHFQFFFLVYSDIIRMSQALDLLLSEPTASLKEINSERLRKNQ